MIPILVKVYQEIKIFSYIYIWSVSKKDGGCRPTFCKRKKNHEAFHHRFSFTSISRHPFVIPKWGEYRVFWPVGANKATRRNGEKEGERKEPATRKNRKQCRFFRRPEQQRIPQLLHYRWFLFQWMLHEIIYYYWYL